MAEFRMPTLGADMTEGVLLEWLVHPGQVVHKGDIVAVVDTSKAAVEVECFDTGVIDRLLVSEGARVPVGTPLAVIETTPGAGRPEAKRSRARRAAQRPKPAQAPSPMPDGHPVTSPLVRRLAEAYHIDTETVHGSGVGGRVTRGDVEHAHESGGVPAKPPTRLRISPLARRAAAELGVDPAQVSGTGPSGAIGVEDIRRAAAAQTATVSAEQAPMAAPPAPIPERAQAAEPAPAAPSSEHAAAMRATIAAAMSRAKREIPHYYLTHTIDMGTAMTWLHERNLQRPPSARLLPAALLLKAAARAATAVPALNGFWIDGAHAPAPDVHLGVAISLRGGGLVAPAIHDTARLDIDELMAAMRDLVVRARAGRLRGSELSDATLTVSNMGDQGVESIIGVIYPPQVALVGFGAIVERPWALNGMLGVRPVVVASLSGDHRATDGATGARYLKTLEQLLQKPEEL